MRKKEHKLKVMLFKKQIKTESTVLRGKPAATVQTHANERTHRVWIAKTLKVILAL